MSYGKIIPTNKVVDEVYEKHVKHSDNGLLTNKLQYNVKLNAEQVADIICLYIYGAPILCLKDVYDYNVDGVIHRNSYRNIKIPFQTSRKKKLGKMVFTYDKELVEEHFNSLPEHLKGLSDGVIREDRLVKVTKILKSEMWI